ncbi:MAG: hypothetical protein WBN88_19240, partial [Anderseniella sp.]
MKVGLLGLESHGLRERSIALDILHALTRQHGHEVVFNLDAAFDDRALIWGTVETQQMDLLAVSLRASSGTLLPRLKSALQQRQSNGLKLPKLVFGGTTALASPDKIREIFPDSTVCTSDAEAVFPEILS